MGKQVTVRLSPEISGLLLELSDKSSGDTRISTEGRTLPVKTLVEYFCIEHPVFQQIAEKRMVQNADLKRKTRRTEDLGIQDRDRHLHWKKEYFKLQEAYEICRVKSLELADSLKTMQIKFPGIIIKNP